MREIYENLDCLEDIYELIKKAIVEEPPVSVTEGGLIKKVTTTRLTCTG